MFEWFGKSILGEIEDAEKYILPGPILSPHERIQIYQEQYYLRHRRLIEDAYPSLKEHGEVLDLYVKNHPPSNWSLYEYGDSLLNWLRNEYPELVNLALVDRAFKKAFISPEYPPLSTLDVDKLILQPFVHLFDFEHPRFAPNVSSFHIIYLSKDKELMWKGILEEQFKMLKCFENPCSIEDAIEGIEDESLITQSFQLFTKLNWITCQI